jgi:hypothetical protein
MVRQRSSTYFSLPLKAISAANVLALVSYRRSPILLLFLALKGRAGIFVVRIL